MSLHKLLAVESFHLKDWAFSESAAHLKKKSFFFATNRQLDDTSPTQANGTSYNLINRNDHVETVKLVIFGRLLGASYQTLASFVLDF